MKRRTESTTWSADPVDGTLRSILICARFAPGKPPVLAAQRSNSCDNK
jgi:hypothetical protein